MMQYRSDLDQLQQLRQIEVKVKSGTYRFERVAGYLAKSLGRA